MARSLWKGPFCEITPEIQKIKSRRSIILPQFIGRQLLIYNGKSLIPLKVSEDMIGHKFGEFAITRRKPIHKKKKQTLINTKKMTLKRKNLLVLKTQGFVFKYPLIVFLQHNNLKVTDWSALRLKLKEIHDSNLFLFKNSIMKNVLMQILLPNSNFNNQTINYIFQGPSFAFGCKTTTDLKNLYKIIDATPNLVVIGGFYSKQIINHLDIKKLLSLNPNELYNPLLNILQSPVQLCTILEQTSSLDSLLNVQLNLLTCLGYLKNVKETAHYFVYV